VRSNALRGQGRSSDAGCGVTSVDIDIRDPVAEPRAYAGSMRWSARCLGLAITLVVVSLVGCADCRRSVTTGTIDERQVAMLVEGTNAPTPHGCEVTCWDLRFGGGDPDSGVGDAGVAAIVSGSSRDGEVWCTLTGRTLSCDGPILCAR
jgi:hypothetical protein